MRIHLLPFVIIVSATVFTSRAAAQKGDSITVAIAPEYDKVTKMHRVLFGETYRKLWAAPIKVRIIHLKTEKGGLSVVEKGGGLQTKSLKLKDGAGNEWVLRSIQKYPERALPPRLKATIAKDILQDQVATGHPFAALTVPPFAAALGILHSNPEIVYIGDDPALGQYKADFANSVLLLEERDPTSSTDTDNSEKTEEKLLKDNANHVNQKMVLRARLLDLFLGDWDRHEGQWRWDEKKEDNGSRYAPIPRDRDKVYYNTGGILPWILSHQSLKSNLQGFHNDVRDIAGYNFNNRYFDRIFLNELSEEDWLEQISYVQSALTDNLIATAIRRLPAPVYQMTGKKIINTLIARRGMLKKEALKYYRFLSKRVDIPASDKPELIKVANTTNGNVAVSMYKMTDGLPKKTIYSRVFDAKNTKDIRLYGLGGNDVFAVTANQKFRIKTRMIGGDGVDTFKVNEDLQKKGKLFVYDRSDQNNVLPPKRLARIKTSTDTLVNQYDPHNFKYDKSGPKFAVVYVADQGAMLRVGAGYQKHGFLKEPFAENHVLALDYGTLRQSFIFEYSAYLTKVIKNNDLSINVLSKGPNNVNNFFGIGNETEFVNREGKDIEYYRNKFNLFSADIRLRHHFNEAVTLNAGLAGQYYTSSPSANSTHFFKNYNALHPGDNVFSSRVNAGIVGGATVDTRNNGLFSSRGVLWETELTAMQQLNGDKKPFASISSEVNFYLPVSNDSNIVIANRVGAGTSIGSPAFFNQMQLGGIRNLRGFHTFRFTGKTMLFHNLDLRCKLFDFNSYLFPGTIGVVGFNDVGRVWTPGEKSTKWHDGYGAGLYIIPAELILIQVLVGHSVEGTVPYISIGFTF